MSKANLSLSSSFNTTNNTVNSETFNSNANIFYATFPLTDGLGESLSFTFLPKTHNLRISGLFRGTEAEMRTFFTQIFNQVKARDQIRQTYTNTFGLDFTVKIDQFTVSTSNVENGVLSYEINFVVTNVS